MPQLHPSPRAQMTERKQIPWPMVATVNLVFMVMACEAIYTASALMMLVAEATVAIVVGTVVPAGAAGRGRRPSR